MRYFYGNKCSLLVPKLYHSIRSACLVLSQFVGLVFRVFVYSTKLPSEKCFEVFNSETFSYVRNFIQIPLAFLFLFTKSFLLNKCIKNERWARAFFTMSVVINSFERTAYTSHTISIRSVKMFDFSVNNLLTWINSIRQIFSCLQYRQYVRTLSAAYIIIQNRWTEYKCQYM